VPGWLYILVLWLILYLVMYICQIKSIDVGFCPTKFKLCPTKSKSNRTNVLSSQIFICSPDKGCHMCQINVTSHLTHMGRTLVQCCCFEIVFWHKYFSSVLQWKNKVFFFHYFACRFFDNIALDNFHLQYPSNCAILYAMHGNMKMDVALWFYVLACMQTKSCYLDKIFYSGS
jgi:hypothetical protein